MADPGGNTSSPPLPPRRFRRRLLAVMLATGLLPLLCWGAVEGALASRVFSLTLAPLEPMLERTQSALRGRDAGLEAELREARLNLAQAELARRSLARLLPLLLLGALAASAALLFAGAALIGRALSSPVEQLASGMLRVERGDLSQPLPERPGAAADELQLLIRQFNRMSRELLAQRERLRLTENLAAWQEVARGLAHELRNPLTAMKLALARMGRQAGRGATAAAGATSPGATSPGATSPGATSPGAPGGDASAETAERMREATALLAEEIDVLLRMTDNFAQFARLPPPSPRPIDLAAVLHEACALYRAGAAVPIECTAQAQPAMGDPDQLRRLFGNLIKNALEASQPNEEPQRVEVLLQADALRACITVRDRGPGLPAALAGAQLLRSLGSSKPGGSGLGLPIAQKIAHDHGGTLSLRPREGRGTDAIVELPLSLPPGAA